MKASQRIVAHYKTMIEMRNGMPLKEYFTHPSNGRRVENAVHIPVRLLNLLLKEVEKVNHE